MIEMTGHPGWPALSGAAVRVIVRRSYMDLAALGGERA